MDPVTLNPQTPEEAWRRIRAYLRCLGIKEEHALDRAAEVILRRSAATAGCEADLAAFAVEQAVLLKEQWFSQLAADAPAEETALGGLHIRTALHCHPPDERALDRLPDAVVEDSRRASGRATPVEQPAQMPAQPLGGLPRILRFAFRRKRAAAAVTAGSPSLNSRTR